MPIRREASYIGLKDNEQLRYDVVDRDPLSKDFFEVVEFPETLTAGKNVFKFRGDPDSLVDDSNIYVEILDYNGDPVYYDVLPYMEKDGVRVLAVWVYPDTPEGRCTFYLAGRMQLDPESGQRYRYSSDQNSDLYKNLPNVLWKRTTRIAPNRRNGSEIIFLQQPKVAISEQVKTFAQITDLPTFFKQVSGSVATGMSVSGTGPAGGYSTITTNISVPTAAGIANQVVTAVWPAFAAQAQANANMVMVQEAQFSGKTIAKAMGKSKVASAMPSTLANSPAVAGTINNLTAAQTKTQLQIADPAQVINNALGNVGNQGPGGTTLTALPPPTKAAADLMAAPQNEVTSIQTVVYNPPDTTTATFVGLPLTGSLHLGATVIINRPVATVPNDTWLNSAGEAVHVSAASEHVSEGGGSKTIDCTYVATIVDIENSTTAKLSPAFDFSVGRVSKPQDGEHIIDFNPSTVTMSFWVPQMTAETENSMSFAHIKLSNIEPATGDVMGVKTSYKMMGAPGDFIDTGTSILELQEVMVDTGSTSADVTLGLTETKIGQIADQNHIGLYYEFTGGEGKFDMDTLNESIQIKSTDPLTQNTGVKMQLKKEFRPICFANSEYAFQFFAKAINTGSMNAQNVSPTDARIDVYMSGSSISDARTYNGGIQQSQIGGGLTGPFTDSQYGNYLGTLESVAGGAAVFNRVEFVPEYTETFTPIFVIRKGSWFITNISLTANLDTGFSPNFHTLNIRIPTDAMNAPMAFRFQYVDYLGAPAQTETYAQGAIFDGDNNYFEGDSGLITGSITIGNTVGSGIELAGVSSAFIRSIGYQGFTSASAGKGSGFLFYSASVLPDSPDGYGGVGLELVQDSSSFFRFATSGSISGKPAGLEIRTDSFFLGGDDSFISGANGAIEITSSNFHLDRQGDVIMQGTITAEAGGTIGGWGIGTTTLSSSNNSVILDADGPYHISSSGFQVDSDGRVSASAGLIGGFTLGDHSLETSGVELNDSTQTYFISSSTFKVKHSGEVTGSDVQFDGGVVAGWTIDGTNLKSTSDYIVLQGDNTPFVKVQSDTNNTVNMFYNSATDWGLLGTVGTEKIFELGSENQIAGINFISGSLYRSNRWRISASLDTADPVSFISSSAFKVSADGTITGSDILLGDKAAGNFLQFLGSTLTVQGTITADNIQTPASIGGSPSTLSNASASITSQGLAKFVSASIGGFEVQTDVIKSLNEDLILRSDGRITGSQVLFDGGDIAGWNINGDMLSSSNAFLEGGATPELLVRKSADDFVRTHFAASDNWGLMGKSGGNILFALGANVESGEEDNQIAGWAFDNEKLTGGNMIIRKEGTIESDGFVSNLAGSGFRLTAVSGGFLEVENARIRGTLSTAVFEKETVNAVGGQLYVANSSVLTGSALHPGAFHDATDTTMSIANVSGFTYGEILSLKKVSSTGFTTEYVRVQSASRFDASSDTDFGGFLFVTRSISYDGSPTHGPSGSLGDSPFAAQSYTGSQVIVSTGKINTGYIRLNANPNDPFTPYMQIVERTGSGLYDLNLAAQVGDLSGITDSSFSDGVTGHGIYTTNGYFKGKIEVSSLPTAPPSEGLILHLPFDGFISTGSFGSSSLLQDVSGFRQHENGTIQIDAGTAVTCNSSSAKIGGSAVFPGVTDKTGKLTLNPIQLYDNHTFAHWLKIDKSDTSQMSFSVDADTSFTNPHGGGALVAGVGGAGNNAQLDLWFNGTKILWNTGDGDNNPFQEYPGGPDVTWQEYDGLWTHFAVVNDTLTLTASLYINGQWKGWAKYRNPTMGPAVGADLNIGGYQGAQYAYNFKGEIDDFRIYTGSLTDEEVQALYLSPNAGVGRTIIEGDSITSGHLRSNNWGPSVGSEFSLDNGTFKLGGSSNPKLSWDGTTLLIGGFIEETATSSMLGPYTTNAATTSLHNPSNYAFGGDGFTLTTNTAAEGLNLTSQYMGYYNGGFATYMDSAGNFYLGGDSTGSLMWSAADASLQIIGNIQVQNSESFYMPNKTKADYRIALIESASADPTPGSRVISSSLGYTNYFENTTTGSTTPSDILGYDQGYDLYVFSGEVWNVEKEQMVMNLFDEGQSVFVQANNMAGADVTGSGGTDYPIKQHTSGVASNPYENGHIATGSGLQETDPIGQGWSVWSDSAPADTGNIPITVYSDGGGSTYAPIAISGSIPTISDTGNIATNTTAAYLAFYGTNPRGGRIIISTTRYNYIKETPLERCLDFLLKKDLDQESYQQGITKITGDMVKTGKVQSNNWTDGGQVGSEFNLNDGTFKMGGDTNPSLEFDGTDLIVSGGISASGGLIAGFTIEEDAIYSGTKDTSGFAANNADITIGADGIHTKQFYVDTATGNAGFAGTVTIGTSDLTEANTLNQTGSTTQGSSLIYNPNFELAAPDGRPAGVKAVYGGATATNISFSGSLAASQQLVIVNDSDAHIGAGWPAFHVSVGSEYRVQVRLRGEVVDSSGLYIRMQEYDSELDSGDTHVSYNASISEAGVQEATRQVTQGTQNSSGSFQFERIAGTSVENGPVATSFTDYEFIYRPTSTAKWASLIVLNWTDIAAGDPLIVDRVYAYKEPSIHDGTVGGWTISTDKIKGGNAILSGSGILTLGVTPNASVAGTNKGIYMDGDGSFLAYGNSTNFVKFDASGTSVEIKANTFDLATSTMILDSGTNSGKIALGSTPNTSVAGTNAGIYMDGTGDFLAYGDANNYLKKDGTALTMKAETFDLAATNLTINSAGHYIIDTGNFKVDKGGAITSSAGEIGGWLIANNYIKYDSAGGMIWMGQSSADSGQTEIRISSDGTGVGTSNYVRMYQDHDVDTWGIEGKTSNGAGGTIFHLGETAGSDDNQIAGWQFDSTQLTSNSGDGGQTFLKANGQITASSMLLSGSAVATNFATKVVTVTNGNVSDYTRAVTGGVNLVFDGSQGGDRVMHMILDHDPGLIKGFDLVDDGTEVESQILIDVIVAITGFDDGISTSMQQMNALRD